MDSFANHCNGMMVVHTGSESDGTVMDVEHHAIEDDEMMENNSNETLVLSGESNLFPFVGMEFESEEAAKLHYNSYARLVGFSTRVSVSYCSKRDGTLISRQLVCSKEGFRAKRDENFEAKRPQREVTRVGCKAMIMLKRQESGNWVVSRFIKDHNHELASPDKVHCLRSHRHISGTAKSLIHTLHGAGIGPHGIMSVLIKESGGVGNVGFTRRDCSNYISSSRMKTPAKDAQTILSYLKQMNSENSSFFYSVQGDEDHVNTILWVDARSRRYYKHFGDAVTFDTTYRAHRFRMPFAAFTGVNHHGQPILFGCALLLEENELSFTWLFRTWLEVMSGKHPISITIDQDRDIREAVQQILPKTRARFFKWNILRKCQEKLTEVYLAHPSFQAELHKCINLTETIDEFESYWESILDKYNLRNNEWLQSLYNVRQQWIPAYLRDTFFGELSTIQGSENINTFFDGYVNAQTSLRVLITQYEKALDSRYEREVKADSDTRSTKPTFKTPSPMEKQAAELYTRRIFMKFQDELVDTLVHIANKVEEEGATSIYRVVKFEVEHKSYTVTFNNSEVKANCSCQMFEYSGILCRHILTVFRFENILMIPAHYFLKRWTISAQNDIELDTQENNTHDTKKSQTLQFNSLRHEAIKYAEDGTSSREIYNVAMRALREAAEKVTTAKKNASTVPQFESGMHGNNQEDCLVRVTGRGRRCGPNQSQSLDDEKKKIEELTDELNLTNRECEKYREQILMLTKKSKR